MHDKFKKRFRAPRADARLRQQIAREAARRMFGAIGPEEGSQTLRDASEAEYYAAKRKAAAVLGHTVRPGDLGCLRGRLRRAQDRGRVAAVPDSGRDVPRGRPRAR